MQNDKLQLHPKQILFMQFCKGSNSPLSASVFQNHQIKISSCFGQNFLYNIYYFLKVCMPLLRINYQNGISISNHSNLVIALSFRSLSFVKKFCTYESVDEFVLYFPYCLLILAFIIVLFDRFFVTIFKVQ